MHDMGGIVRKHYKKERGVKKAMANAKEAIKDIIIDYENQINEATTFARLNDIVSNILGSTRVLIALGYLDEAQELHEQCTIAFDIMRKL